VMFLFVVAYMCIAYSLSISHHHLCCPVSLLTCVHGGWTCSNLLLKFSSTFFRSYRRFKFFRFFWKEPN
jgi:hypothetical protein